MNKTRALIALSIFTSLANIVISYLCFEIQQKQYEHVQAAVYDAIRMIEDNLDFEEDVKS